MQRRCGQLHAIALMLLVQAVLTQISFNSGATELNNLCLGPSNPTNSNDESALKDSKPSTDLSAPKDARVGTDTLKGVVDGGQSTVGCLGCVVTLRGTISKIFPESDLNRFQIRPKDKIIRINGRKFHPFQFQKECVGIPGSELKLEISRRGISQEITIYRIDARLLSNYARRYKHLSEQNKYW